MQLHTPAHTPDLPPPGAAIPEIGERIRGWLAAREGEIAALTATLVGVPSENPPGVHYEDCAGVLAGRLDALGLPPEVLGEPAVPWGPVVTATVGAAGRALYFHGHYDVVPAQHRSQFEPRLDGGVLHGRGSADMKGGLAAMIYAAAALRACEAPLAGRVRLVCVPDEETAGARGTAALAARGLIERDAVGMLTPEPTSDIVWHASRGAISLRVIVRGVAAHVGLHFRGVDAFAPMVELAREFLALGAEVSRRRTAYPIEPSAAAHSVLLAGGRVEGGTNFNVVADRVSFTVDRRINPEEDFATERARLLEIVAAARARGVDVEVEVLQEGEASATPADSDLARALAAEVRTATGATPRFELCPGLLETRYYARAGVPALAYGPGRLEVAHAPDEHVAVGRLVECAAIYALTALRLLSR